ncbi:hypothetical protein PR048_022200 [Dryococelus australis]|uniref:Transposase n=1 Tax=Dryococelus australis TaxID=614101 RepID=A0ABQ9H0F1_9NEOP|nr:hypothetical protein PR048_022200 [Dryococelus australis]
MYCWWFMEHVTPDGEELDGLYWSDEWFHLAGYVNAQSSCYWSTDNSHRLHESPFHAQKIGVWCAMSRKRISILFFNTIINSERYFQLVRQFFESLTNEEKETWFQQDSTTTHTTRMSMAFLKSVLPGCIITKPL